MSFYASAAQTVGPYFKLGFDWLYESDAAGPDAKGERLEIRGRVLDGDGEPVPDAIIEIWQADADGRYRHPEDSRNESADPGFRGFARVPTATDGRFVIRTVKPGSVPGPQGTMQAPHLNVLVMMRGLLKHVSTRLYFPDEPANASDSVLALVPAPRRASLIAMPLGDGAFDWIIRMQGEHETVFLEY